ncbi:DMT family transporter [Rhizobium sp. L1K21]|uniref:DMT family transporter n=1 Tax=Rhizobium sp. L1K21 TaxID=2954933 RepID=UPI002093AE48|nr:DMT family transporter [Rhizobium sp. L1K21]MCO6185342.1 DMT family transporter [Rhizobium sp. L1K21]
MNASTVTHNTHAKGIEKVKAHLAVLLFALLISGSFSLGGMAAKYIPSAAINVPRYAVAVLAMWLYASRVQGVSLTFPKSPWRFAVLGLLMAIYMFTMFVALEFTSPVATGAVFTLMPLLSAVFAWILMRQRSKPAVILSLIVAASGAIWVIFRGNVEALLAFNVGRGEMIYFVGVVAHAAYAPLLRLYNRGEDAAFVGFWAVAATGLWLLIPGIPSLLQINLLAMPPIVWVTILYLGIITTALTYMLLQYATLRLPTSKTLAYGYLIPTFVIVLEGLIGHGWVDISIWAGALVTATALAIAALLPD